MLKGRMVSMESGGGNEGFSILYNLVLQKELEDGNAPLMYLAARWFILNGCSEVYNRWFHFLPLPPITLNLWCMMSGRAI